MTRQGRDDVGEIVVEQVVDELGHAVAVATLRDEVRGVLQRRQGIRDRDGALRGAE